MIWLFLVLMFSIPANSHEKTDVSSPTYRSILTMQVINKNNQRIQSKDDSIRILTRIMEQKADTLRMQTKILSSIANDPTLKVFHYNLKGNASSLVYRYNRRIGWHLVKINR